MNTMKTQQNTTYVYFKCQISIAVVEYFLLIAREKEVLTQQPVTLALFYC